MHHPTNIDTNSGLFALVQSEREPNSVGWIVNSVRKSLLGLEEKEERIRGKDKRKSGVSCVWALILLCYVITTLGEFNFERKGEFHYFVAIYHEIGKILSMLASSYK